MTEFPKEQMIQFYATLPLLSLFLFSDLVKEQILYLLFGYLLI